MAEPAVPAKHGRKSESFGTLAQLILGSLPEYFREKSFRQKDEQSDPLARRHGAVILPGISSAGAPSIERATTPGRLARRGGS
jgi:hypothetical protein